MINSPADVTKIIVLVVIVIIIIVIATIVRRYIEFRRPYSCAGFSLTFEKFLHE